MSCSPFDIRDYFLQELPDPQQRLVETHVKTCQPCREELDRLQFTKAAMFALPDEEIPQRIAFVSDKIFEPSPLRRWMAGFWGSAARLGFASAAMLSAAIAVHAFRPVAPIAQAPAPAPAPPQVVRTESDAEIQAKVDAAVSKAVSIVEAREGAKTEQLVAKLNSMQQQVVWAMGEAELLQKRTTVQRAANYSMPVDPDAREPK